MKVKVGDWVKPLVNYIGQDGCSYTFEENAYQIERFNGDKIYLKGVDYPCFEEGELELVCGFKKGERVVSDCGDTDLEFYAYDPKLNKPFLCKDISDNDYGDIYNYISIHKPEYKPYSEPKLEWVLKETLVKFKKYPDSDPEPIMSVGKRGLVLRDFGYISFSFAFDECTWLDGTPFGEVKDAN